MMGTAEATKLFELTGKDLSALQKELDLGHSVDNFKLVNFTLSGEISLKRETRQGRNVLARLAGDPASKYVVVVGAHVDHLGQGNHSSSLAHTIKEDAIHHGADDNASGTAIMLALAKVFSDEKKEHFKAFQNDIIFAAWSGEEIGILGSQHFVNTLTHSKDSRTMTDGKKIIAYINMDMVGRLREKLVLQGIGSSSVWKSLIQKANIKTKLPLSLQSDPYLPTDATSFYLKGIPVINAFTGAHEDYHAPTDTPDKINYSGLNRITHLLKNTMHPLAQTQKLPDYIARKAKKRKGGRGLRIYLGTIPDYAASEVEGLKISGTSSESPAAEAGLVKGDIIVELAGKKINDIYDYMHALNALKAKKTVDIKVKRQNKIRTLKITPQMRE